MTEATPATLAPDALADVLVDAPFARLVATDTATRWQPPGCSRERCERSARRFRSASPAIQFPTTSTTASR